jgi:hypothetical protein
MTKIVPAANEEFVAGARLWHGKCGGGLDNELKEWGGPERIELVVSVDYGMVFLR